MRLRSGRRRRPAQLFAIRIRSRRLTRTAFQRVLDERFEVVAFYRVFGTSAPKVAGQSFFQPAGRWDNPRNPPAERGLPQNNVVKDFQVAVEAHGGSKVFLLDARVSSRSTGNGRSSSSSRRCDRGRATEERAISGVLNQTGVLLWGPA